MPFLVLVVETLDKETGFFLINEDCFNSCTEKLIKSEVVLRGNTVERFEK